MLAKIIVHSSTREDAARKARRALQDLILLGCETNAGFLSRVLSDEGFLSGQVHTGYLDEHPQLAEGKIATQDLPSFLAAAALLTRPVRDAADAIPELYAALGGWRN